MRKLCAATIVFNQDHEVLLLKSEKRGTWEFPGGKQDGTETLVQCARRELLEETGLEVGYLELVGYSDAGNKHLVVFFRSHTQGTPEVREPDKHSKLEWFKLDELPSPLGAYMDIIQTLEVD